MDGDGARSILRPGKHDMASSWLNSQSCHQRNVYRLFLFFVIGRAGVPLSCCGKEPALQQQDRST